MKHSFDWMQRRSQLNDSLSLFCVRMVCCVSHAHVLCIKFLSWHLPVRRMSVCALNRSPMQRVIRWIPLSVASLWLRWNWKPIHQQRILLICLHPNILWIFNENTLRFIELRVHYKIDFHHITNLLAINIFKHFSINWVGLKWNLMEKTPIVIMNASRSISLGFGCGCRCVALHRNA